MGSTTRWAVAAVVAALTLAPAAARAQTTIPISVTLPVILETSSSGALALTVGDADYQAGYVAGSSVTVTHRGNVTYRIGVNAASDRLTYSGTPDPGKQATDLLLTTDQDPMNYRPVGTAGSPLELYRRNAQGSWMTSQIYARLLLDYAKDPPGIFSTTLSFTLSQ